MTWLNKNTMNRLPNPAEKATRKHTPIPDRARRYVSKMTPSIQGSNGSTDAIKATAVLLWGFLLDHETAIQVFQEEFNLRCRPPWSEAEIHHKVRSSQASGPPPGKQPGWLLVSPNLDSSNNFHKHKPAPKKPLKVTPELAKERVTHFLDGMQVTEQDALAASAITVPEPSPIGQTNLQALTYLEALYDELDMVNIVTKSKQVGGKWVPTGCGHSYPVNIWREEGITVQSSNGGAWVGVNTFDDMGVCNENVVGFPYVLVEHDDLSRDLQLSFLFKLGETAPLVAVIDTGGKSIHGVFKVSGIHSLDSYNRAVGLLYDRLAWAGIDRNCKTASRRTRLPGAIRGQHRQRLLYLNPEGTLNRKEAA